MSIFNGSFLGRMPTYHRSSRCKQATQPVLVGVTAVPNHSVERRGHALALVWMLNGPASLLCSLFRTVEIERADALGSEQLSMLFRTLREHEAADGRDLERPHDVAIAVR